MWWLGNAARGECRARTRMVPQGSVRSGPDARPSRPPDLERVTAILGGLAAAVLWATATLASSRSSRMIGSRVVLAWVMIVGTIVGLPIALATGVPTEVPPGTLPLVLLAGLCYSAGLYVHVQGADHRQGLDRGADRRDGGRRRGADRRRARGPADARRGAPAGGHRRRRRPVQHRTRPPRRPGRRHRARGGRPRRPGPRRCPGPRRGPRGARRRRRRADPQDRAVLRGGRLDLRRRPRGGRQVRASSSRRSGSPSARGSSAWRSSLCRSSCSDGSC